MEGIVEYITKDAFTFAWHYRTAFSKTLQFFFIVSPTIFLTPKTVSVDVTGGMKRIIILTMENITALLSWSVNKIDWG